MENPLCVYLALGYVCASEMQDIWDLALVFRDKILFEQMSWPIVSHGTPERMKEKWTYRRASHSPFSSYSWEFSSANNNNNNETDCLLSPPESSQPLWKYDPVTKLATSVPQPQFTTICAKIKINGFEKRIKTERSRDFPGGPVVKAPWSQCKGVWFNSWSGN